MKNLITKSMIMAMLIAISVQYSPAQDTTKAVPTVEQSATKPVKAKKAKTKVTKKNSSPEIEDIYDKIHKNNAKISELVKENKELRNKLTKAKRINKFKKRDFSRNRPMDNKIDNSDLKELKQEMKELKQEMKLLKEKIK